MRINELDCISQPNNYEYTLPAVSRIQQQIHDHCFTMQQNSFHLIFDKLFTLCKAFIYDRVEV